jgi:RNA polymerase sigma-70 factor (ECF subfamily)
MDSEHDGSTGLMVRLQNGEESALNQLMAEWQTPLVSFIYRYIGDHSGALDLAQETFVRVYQNRLRYQPRAKFSSWLFTIASNLCRNHLRWQTRHPVVALAPDEEDGPAQTADTFPSPERIPSDNAQANDLARCVRESIHGLPHDLKTVVLLFEYEDLSYEEISGVLGCSPKAVETRLYRARKILREKLAHFHPQPGEKETKNS